MQNIHILDADAPVFPPTTDALSEPKGLLALGGNLLPSTLIDAYSQGIFPWFDDDQPILWWSPEPRMVLTPSEVHISRSLAKAARRKTFVVSVDQAFAEVIDACSQAPRHGQDGTWITEDMREAYIELHQRGCAHSIEVWQDGALVGGLYGVAIGSAFFGESMFARVSNASKHGFVSLCKQLQQWKFSLIDCQVHTEHLQRFGAKEVSRVHFETALARAINARTLATGDRNWAELWNLPQHGFIGYD